MPIISSREVSLKPPHYNLLIIAPAKVGKTTAAVATAPGNLLVVRFEGPDSLTHATRQLRSRGREYDLLPVAIEREDGARDAMLKALQEVHVAARDGAYESIVFDSVGFFGQALEREMQKRFAGDKKTGGNYSWLKENGGHFFAQLTASINRYAHVIVTTNYCTVELPTLSGQAPRQGDGIFPGWPGGLRTEIPGMFSNVVWLQRQQEQDRGKRFWCEEAEKPPYNGRVFTTLPGGAFGAGCRALAGAETVPADVSKLFQSFDENEVPAAGKISKLQPRTSPQARPAVKPPAPRAQPKQLVKR